MVDKSKYIGRLCTKTSTAKAVVDKSRYGCLGASLSSPPSPLIHCLARAAEEFT
jgi:hypothetical protein